LDSYRRVDAEDEYAASAANILLNCHVLRFSIGESLQRAAGKIGIDRLVAEGDELIPDEELVVGGQNPHRLLAAPAVL
jgi:hypothetical protein